VHAKVWGGTESGRGKGARLGDVFDRGVGSIVIAACNSCSGSVADRTSSYSEVASWFDSKSPGVETGCHCTCSRSVVDCTPGCSAAVTAIHCICLRLRVDCDVDCT
jgi:hypothetical protein